MVGPACLTERKLKRRCTSYYCARAFTMWMISLVVFELRYHLSHFFIFAVLLSNTFLSSS